jgi:hypothetical protein
LTLPAQPTLNDCLATETTGAWGHSFIHTFFHCHPQPSSTSQAQAMSMSLVLVLFCGTGA